MRCRFAWFLRWLAYRFVMLWPVSWWPMLLVLPYAGDYAYCTYREFRIRQFPNAFPEPVA